VHEFWSSDLRRLFARAGLPRRLPPAFHPDCPIGPVAGPGIAPRITSPRADVVYSLRAGANAPAQIAFSAVADGDARELYWFLDGRLLGRSDSTALFYWAAQPGRFTVRAVDAFGRAAALPIRVEVVQ
jgi:penicillin-binding protein 1C